eukprot:14312200-Alexandrium_andersonii.AAC.1
MTNIQNYDFIATALARRQLPTLPKRTRVRMPRGRAADCHGKLRAFTLCPVVGAGRVTLAIE